MITNEVIFQCSDCGLHYKDAKIARKCEAYCKKHKACSMEVTKHSIERLRSILKSSKDKKS